MRPRVTVRHSIYRVEVNNKHIASFMNFADALRFARWKATR